MPTNCVTAIDAGKGLRSANSPARTEMTPNMTRKTQLLMTASKGISGGIISQRQIKV